MVNEEREIPVFLFTGFLEAGKTRFVQGILEDPEFCEGENTLLLLCEEGEVEYNPSRFIDENTFIEVINNKELLDDVYLNKLVERHNAQRVCIEYNGMWELDALFSNMPEDWIIYQEFMFADASTFIQYNANMRQQMYDKLQTCNCLVLNRSNEQTDKEEIHKIIRGANRQCDIIYEDKDGNAVADEIEDTLPYDLDAPLVEIEDRDYAIWYRDMGEEMDKYEGKLVRVRVFCADSSRLPEGVFVVGRQLMTCCEADIKPAGIACSYPGPKPQPMTWVYITGIISIRKSKAYDGQTGPVILVQKIEETEAPQQPVATFY